MRSKQQVAVSGGCDKNSPIFWDAPQSFEKIFSIIPLEVKCLLAWPQHRPRIGPVALAVAPASALIWRGPGLGPSPCPGPRPGPICWSHPSWPDSDSHPSCLFPFQAQSPIMLCASSKNCQTTLQCFSCIADKWVRIRFRESPRSEPLPYRPEAGPGSDQSQCSFHVPYSPYGIF